MGLYDDKWERKLKRFNVFQKIKAQDSGKRITHISRIQENRNLASVRRRRPHRGRFFRFDSSALRPSVDWPSQPRLFNVRQPDRWGQLRAVLHRFHRRYILPAANTHCHFTSGRGSAFSAFPAFMMIRGNETSKGSKFLKNFKKMSCVKNPPCAGVPHRGICYLSVT